MSSKSSKKTRSKRSSHTKSWSDWLYDQQLGWHRTRTTSNGQTQTEYRDEPPQIEGSVPRSDSALSPDSRRESSAVDNYFSPTSYATPPYSCADAPNYTPFNVGAEATYSTVAGQNPAYRSERSDVACVTGQLASIRMSEAGPPLPSLSSTSNPVQTGVPKHSRASFQKIGDGRKFFKVGRVFATLWAEPAGSNARESSFIFEAIHREMMYSKVRRFVVVREQRGCCWCAPLNTYGSQGAKKPGVTPRDHAAVYDSRKPEPQPLSGEGLTKKPFPIIVETEGEDIHPMSRINFGRIHTIEHNFKVKKVGRIPAEHIRRLERYFDESSSNKGGTSRQELSIEEDNDLSSESAPVLPDTSSAAPSYSSPVAGYDMASGYGSNTGDWNPTVASYDTSVYGSGYVSTSTHPLSAAPSYYPTTYGVVASSDQPRPEPSNPTMGYPTMSYDSRSYVSTYDSYESRPLIAGYSSLPISHSNYGGEQNTNYYSMQSPVPWNPTPFREEEASKPPTDFSAPTATWQSQDKDIDEDDIRLPTLEEAPRRRESHPGSGRIDRDRKRRR